MARISWGRALWERWRVWYLVTVREGVGHPIRDEPPPPPEPGGIICDPLPTEALKCKSLKKKWPFFKKENEGDYF